MRTNARLTIVILFSFVQSFSQNKNNDTVNTKTLIKIETSVFKYLFDHNASAIQHKASYYYVEITDSANHTLAEVIHALKNITPEVKDIKEYNSLIAEQREKIKFLSLIIHSVKLVKNKAYVDCGYYEGNLSASGNTIILKKRWGKWKVTKEKMLWIS